MDMMSMTAVELGKKIKAGEISVMEATKACIENIKTYDKEYNCFITVDEEGAFKQAEEIQKKTDSNCFFYYPFIQYRKGTRHTGTDRTCMCIRCTTKCGTAAAEYLRLCRKLYMNLQTNHGFVYFTHLTDPFLLQRQAACTLLSAQMHMPPE